MISRRALGARNGQLLKLRHVAVRFAGVAASGCPWDASLTLSRQANSRCYLSSFSRELRDRIQVRMTGSSMRSMFSSLDESDEGFQSHISIPTNLRQKVVSASDAVSLVRDGDTVCCSGFVCQGVPEAVLEALGQRYEATGSPHNLTLLFGGGPGDWASRGLNHLAKSKEDNSEPPMLRRTIGAHYGQVPKIVKLVLNESVEAWTLPLGSVSRMIRAQATHSPGHITTVGLGTYIDPVISGGAVNESAKKSDLHSKLVSRITIEDKAQLMYKALPIHVAIIRGTTADAQGNVTMEDESLLADQRILAVAARNSGGIVIAQVKHLAANGSLPSRDVVIPGPLVDCVVVVDESDHDALHPMSFVERNNPVLTGKIKTPHDELPIMPLTFRKLIARRAFFGLKPHTVVNLGIGLPEGVASVAAEEGMLDFVTLSTEPGVFGGLPSSGQSFGPASNFSALVEMNQMFDFYDGGGLNMSFLGAAQVSRNGDVNVSRVAADKIVGPGGFIDISQSTPFVTFMTPFTTKGLEIDLPGNGTLKIEQEGQMKKFVPEVVEKTFSGDEAVRRGQTVLYVTERAVFRRTGAYPTLELIEIAPGIDLQKDVLDQMDFEPIVSPNLKRMDRRIFISGQMDVRSEMFGSLEDRIKYHEGDHTIYIDLYGVTLNTEDDIRWFADRLEKTLVKVVEKKGRVVMVANYDGFDLRKGLEDKYKAAIGELEDKYYSAVKRYSGRAFRRAQLGRQMSIRDLDPADLYAKFDTDSDGMLSVEEIRTGMNEHFHIRLTPAEVHKFYKETNAKENEPVTLDRDTFIKAIKSILDREQEHS